MTCRQLARHAPEVVSSDGLKPHSASQSPCRAPIYGCLLAGAYLPVATSWPTARTYLGATPESCPSPPSADGRFPPKPAPWPHKPEAAPCPSQPLVHLPADRHNQHLFTPHTAWATTPTPFPGRPYTQAREPDHPHAPDTVANQPTRRQPRKPPGLGVSPLRPAPACYRSAAAATTAGMS